MLKPSAAPLVMPYPREMEFAGGSVPLKAVAIRAADAVTRRTARVLKRELKALGLPVADGGYPVSLVRLDQPGLDDEMYSLEVGKSGAVVGAASYAGLYYGVQTLAQLLAWGQAPRVGTRAAVRLPLCSILDYPLKPIRGIHTYLPARENLPFFKRFVEWLGRHKINTIFLEVGGGMEYRRHPEVNRAWEAFCREALAYPGGPDALQDSQWFAKNSTHTELAGGSFLTQDECRQIVQWCRENAIAVMPEVQSLSHSYYLCMAHPEIAEVKEDPWPDNYCPSNPRSYELYFELLEEIIEVFDPSLIHIGHDEAYIFNFCPRCKQRDAAEIYATDITKIHDWLAGRGIRTAIWGDKLLNIVHPNGNTYGGVERNTMRYGRQFHQPATNRCKDLIPRDVLIFDWYWSLSYESAQMLADMGYQMIYGNFHGPSFQGWQKHRQNPALLGGETSLWCAVDDYSIGRNGTFHNILWGANDLWSDVDPDAERERIVSDIAAVMRQDRLKLSQLKSVIQSPAKLKFKPIDMTTAGRRGLYLGEGVSADLRFLPVGQQTLGDVPFLLPDGDKASVPSVDWHIRATPPVPINAEAEALCFLHTTTIPAVHAPTYYSLDLGPNIIGAYLVEYEDGSTTEVPLEYAMNIDSINSGYMIGKAGDQSATIGAYDYLADPVVSGKTNEGGTYTLFMVEWVNPRPTKAIRSVRLLWKAGYNQGLIALIAVTEVRRCG
ncbi:beta-N-acetylhexosaminidase [bacterium]|nr:beta-N-acetylhexosaminidase [bacterium]